MRAADLHHSWKGLAVHHLWKDEAGLVQMYGAAEKEGNACRKRREEIASVANGVALRSRCPHVADLPTRPTPRLTGVGRKVLLVHHGKDLVTFLVQPTLPRDLEEYIISAVGRKVLLVHHGKDLVTFLVQPTLPRDLEELRLNHGLVWVRETASETVSGSVR
eukprot:CAMPEP_0119544730 /NCGR_PEP_ID=MMETSP1344-20130328/54879_1 /TAXON_ID=236787 /ORGANISM="Florenciella parvula, Strain CCMP2471" /LENGTH=161 /DNA_ID=CAMNT_0007589235 /DNA_START=38 /DNA_END=523 /DNA_ORIENTATION=-